MDPSDIIATHFHEFSEQQYQLFVQFEKLLRQTNERLNLISRQDREHLSEKHILHSLAIWRSGLLKDGMRVLDIGTGGGLPGIPLAIACPKADFLLIDRIGKKVRAVAEMTAALGLPNVQTRQADTGEIKERFDFITARAVTSLPAFLRFAVPLAKRGGKIAYLKGGDFDEELRDIRFPVRIYQLSEWFAGDFFETKKLVVVYVG